MKIIGKTEKAILVEANQDELANLLGYSWHGEKGCPSLDPGCEILVAPMYDRLASQKYKRKELDELASKLHMMAGLCESLQPVFVELTMEEKGEKEEKR